MAASVWNTAAALNRIVDHLPSNASHVSPENDIYLKSKLSVLLNRVMSISGCSKSARALMATLRGQLKLSLEHKDLVAAGHVTNTQPGSLFDCEYCKGFMVQPVCLPCGHSVCKSCVGNLPKCSVIVQSLVCPNCNLTYSRAPSGLPASPTHGWAGQTFTEQNRKPTLILQNVIQKWYPKWVESYRCREEGNQFANEGDFPLAVHWYTKAVETGVHDHRVLSNRARAYLAMDQLDKALEDAELACGLRPFWAKGHFRRAAALEQQGKWCEALAAYLLCLEFECNDQAVLKRACQLLDSKMSAFSNSTPCLSTAQASSSRSECLTTGSPDGADMNATIIQLCLDMMKQCVEREHDQTSLEVSPDVLTASDFECALCTGLLYSPVTTPCGHSFCQGCLSRLFDHTPYCPICRSVLAENFEQHCQNSGKMSIDNTLDSILAHHFSEAYQEKKAQMDAELLRKSRVGISEQEELPVFVCTIAFPGIPCPMHIFEPRYRLMLRRCMETGSRRFGMCQPAAEEEMGDSVSFSDYGTVLYINSVEHTPDGRSLITSTGERRFRCLNKGKTDGYQVASIVFIFDERVTDPEEIASLRTLQREVYGHANWWLTALPLYTRLRIMQTACSPLPSIDPVPECCPNGPTWVWWFVHALPTTPQKKLAFLKCTSLRERLLMLRAALPIPHQSPR